MLDAYLFVHIPKTAGTSFRHALERVLAGRTAYDYALRAAETCDAVREHVYGKLDLEALGAALARDRVAVLGGHVSYSRYAALFPPERVIAFLRDPISRVVSEYEHACRHNGFEGELVEFAGVQRNRSLQSKMLRGVPLGVAACIGIAERYGESLAVLRQRVGWQLPELVRNVNPKRTVLAGTYGLTGDQEQQLRAWNEDDFALYQEACALLDERVKDAGQR